MVATAGKILTEERLRAYFKCSQLYAFGGESKAEIATQMAQNATEYYLSARLRSPDRDNAYLLTKAVFHASKKCELKELYLAGQEQKLTNQTVLWLDEFVTLFDSNVYYPVTGPLPWRVNVNKTPIDLHISGIFRTKKNQTLHVLSFTPFKNKHAQVNDPVLHLKVKALQEFVKKNPNRPRTIIHNLWATSTGSLGVDSIDSTKINEAYIKVIEQKVKQAERAEYMPLVPCPHTCPFKNQCFVGEEK